MDDIFTLCAFQTPTDGAPEALRTILKAGMPVNIKVGELRNESEFDLEAGLGHLICTYAPPAKSAVAQQMLQQIFEFGFNWMLLDGQQRTAGEIAYERGLTDLYKMFVDAGVRSEILLQKFLEDSSDDSSSSDTESVPDLVNSANEPENVPVEGNQTKFLNNRLQFDEHTLRTDENDGVMMDWETPIMKRSAELITKPGSVVLNIGFGMGIIDSYIQKLRPAKHYIVEAHPQVLERMRAQGWFEIPNVVVLEGTWKSQLPKLIDENVQLDGIYYDTFSEHYRDMLELFDMVVGLLCFDGVFSYFNGLGADRQICYDVYKQVAKFNLKDYGLHIEFEEMPLNVNKSTWNQIKREYFRLQSYALPTVTFAGELADEEGELVAA